jgi:hypothetical protein
MTTKTKREIAEMLKDLPNLCKQAANIPLAHYHDLDELVESGLLTEGERTTLERAERTHDEISEAKRKASDGIPQPDPTPLYPEEYRRLLAKESELKACHKETDGVLGHIYSLATEDRMGLDPNQSAKGIKEVLWNAPDPDYDEFRRVEGSVERKSRAGTKVDKARSEIFAEYRKAQNEAASRVEATLLLRYTDLFVESGHIWELVNSRREELLKPIREKIASLLDGTLKALEEEGRQR